MLTESMEELLDSYEDFGGKQFTNKLIVATNTYQLSRTIDDGVEGGNTFWLVYWMHEELCILPQPHAKLSTLPRVPYIRKRK